MSQKFVNNFVAHTQNYLDASETNVILDIVPPEALQVELASDDVWVAKIADEMVRVIDYDILTNTITVVRGIEDTAIAEHDAGVVIAHIITAESLANIIQDQIYTVNDAAEINVVPAGNITEDKVQSALEQLDANLDSVIAGETPIAAQNITVAPANDITAVEVQAALEGIANPHLLEDLGPFSLILQNSSPQRWEVDAPLAGDYPDEWYADATVNLTVAAIDILPEIEVTGTLVSPAWTGHYVQLDPPIDEGYDSSTVIWHRDRLMHLETTDGSQAILEEAEAYTDSVVSGLASTNIGVIPIDNITENFLQPVLEEIANPYYNREYTEFIWWPWTWGTHEGHTSWVDASQSTENVDAIQIGTEVTVTPIGGPLAEVPITGIIAYIEDNPEGGGGHGNPYHPRIITYFDFDPVYEGTEEDWNYYADLPAGAPCYVDMVLLGHLETTEGAQDKADAAEAAAEAYADLLVQGIQDPEDLGLYKRLYNIEDYGAVGYASEALALAGTDSTVAIQAAADAAYDPDALISAYQYTHYTPRAGAVYIPSNYYKVTATVNIPSGVSVVGNGRAASFLCSTNTTWSNGGYAVIKGANRTTGARYTGFQLLGPNFAACPDGGAYNTANYGVVGLQPGDYAHNITIKDVWTRGFTNGIVMRICDEVTMRSNYTQMPREGGLVILSSMHIHDEASMYSNGGQGIGDADPATWMSNIWIGQLNSTYEVPHDITFTHCYCDETYGQYSIRLNEVHDFVWDGGEGHTTAGEISNNIGLIWTASGQGAGIYIDNAERIKFTNSVLTPFVINEWRSATQYSLNSRVVYPDTRTGEHYIATANPPTKGVWTPSQWAIQQNLTDDALVTITANAKDVDLSGLVINKKHFTREVDNLGIRTILPGDYISPSSYKHLYNIEDYGAVGYASEALALAGVDSTSAIQAAANAAYDPDALGAGGIPGFPYTQYTPNAGAVYIPSNYYKVTAPITIPQGASVVGNGRALSFLCSTFIAPVGNDRAVINGAVRSVGQRFTGFQLLGPNFADCPDGGNPTTGNWGIVGIQPGYMSHNVVIEDIWTRGFTTGILLFVVDGVEMRNNYTQMSRETGLVIASSIHVHDTSSMYSNSGQGVGDADPATWMSNIWVGKYLLGQGFSEKIIPFDITFDHCYCDETYAQYSMRLEQVHDFTWNGGEGHLIAGEISNNIGLIWTASSPGTGIYINEAEKVKFTNSVLTPFVINEWRSTTQYALNSRVVYPDTRTGDYYVATANPPTKGVWTPSQWAIQRNTVNASLITITANAKDVDLSGLIINKKMFTRDVDDSGLRTLLPGNNGIIKIPSGGNSGQILKITKNSNSNFDVTMSWVTP